MRKEKDGKGGKKGSKKISSEEPTTSAANPATKRSEAFKGERSFDPAGVSIVAKRELLLPGGRRVVVDVVTRSDEESDEGDTIEVENDNEKVLSED